MDTNELQYINIFKKRYSCRPDSLNIFNNYLKDCEKIYTVNYDADTIAGGMMCSFLKEKSVRRVGFFVVDKSLEGNFLGTRIVKSVSIDLDIIAFCNKYSWAIFKRNGWMVKQLELCSLNFEECSEFMIDEDYEQSIWIKSRYINHCYSSSYKIFKYNNQTIILKKYEDTCHIIECDFEKITDILPAIKHVAFNIMQCKQITFWYNKHIPNNIIKNKIETWAVFSNKQTYEKFSDNLYMGLSDVY